MTWMTRDEWARVEMTWMTKDDWDDFLITRND